ncbi:MAG: polysaccharide biosynthesis protein [Lachnospiraceae bacterium]|nr:polysaccharide biosynthesis protein [Lachnospiraceae bacterium]
MGKSSKKDGFIIQAGILAAAGIICRMIGLLYRSPLTAVIGDEGNGYYQTAFNVYTIILLISSYSIPSAISKVIAQKLSVQDYINAHRIFKCALWYVLAVGGIASLVLFFCAGWLTKGPAVTVLRVFSPTVFLYGILGVLRGYFQAHRTMVQTSVSQILEQILNAVVSIGAAYLLIVAMLHGTEKYTLNEDYSVSFGGEVVQEMADAALDAEGGVILDEDGNPVYALNAEQTAHNTKHATYGAVGSALGTCAGVAAALLFMWGIYGLNKRTIKRRIARDRHEEESYGIILKTVSSVVVPFILSTAIYNLSTFLNQTVYLWICTLTKGMTNAQASTGYGIFSGKAVVISNIPIAISSAMASAILPSISARIGQGDMDGAREKTGQAVKTTMLIAIPAAVGIGVLARPITWLLFAQKESVDTASKLLMALSASVIFYSLSTLTNTVLQGIGKVKVPVHNAAISLVVQTVTVSGLLYFTDMDLYSLVIAMLVYSGMMCILNQLSIRRYMGYRQEIFRTFVTPLVAAAFMGAAAFGTYQGIAYLLHAGQYPSHMSNMLALFPAVLVGAIVYFVLEIVLKGISEAELRALPKGYLLVKLAKKCHLL